MPPGEAAIEPGTYLVPAAAGWSAVDDTITFLPARTSEDDPAELQNVLDSIPIEE